MANQRVWLINNAQFPFVDSDSGTRFEPGVAIKAELTNFVKRQSVIVRCADPNDDLTEKEQARLQAQIEHDEQERIAAEIAAEQKMAQENGGTPAEFAVGTVGTGDAVLTKAEA